MRSGLLPCVAGLVLVTGPATVPTPSVPLSQTRTEASCEVILSGSGSYRLSVGTGGPYPVVDFKEASGPRFDPIRLVSGNFRDCDREPGDVSIVRSPNASPLLYHVAGELYALARVEWQSSRRPQVEYAYRDFGNLAASVQREMLLVGFRQILAGIASDLIKRYANPAGYLTDKGAKWVAETAVKLMMEAYVEGRDPGLIIDGLLARMVDHLTSQVDALAKNLGGAELSLLLKPQLTAIANDVKKLLVEAQPDGQTVTVDAVGDDCNHFLYLFWNFKGGSYTGRLHISCGPRQPDSIRRIEVTDVVMEPGAATAVTIQALSQLGVPMPLASATANGIAPVPPDGSGEPPAVVAGRTATFNFAAADPRRDADFPFNVSILTDDATGRLSGVARGRVTVLNVGPAIESATPAEAKAKPGEMLTLDGAQLAVLDRNADSRNIGEVAASTITLAHPDGLRTQPRLDRADNPARLSHDGSTGRYQFRFSRSGLVADPHEHGTWPATVTISDDNGATATSTIALTVEDVAPEVVNVSVIPAFVHRGQGARIQVRARVRDRNEAGDITGVTIDATAAGGGVYTLADGLVETGRGTDWIEVQLTAPFPQTDDPGEHPIAVTVSDEKQVGSGGGSLHVGNTAPATTGYGYIFGVDPVADRAGSADGLDVKSRMLCPNDPFRTGMIASDAEGDVLQVTGTIVETGATVTFSETSPRIYVGEMQAPGEPGSYTLRLVAAEVPPDKQVVVEMPLEVAVCEVHGDSALMIGNPFTPADIAAAPRDPAIQLGIGALPGAVVGAQPRDGGAEVRDEGGPRIAELRDSLLLMLDGAAVGSDPLETYVLATGGSTGPVAQLFAINRGERPLRLAPAAVVLEPVALSPAIQARVGDLLRRYVAAGGRGIALDFYCLEFLLRPPAAGMLMRIADRNVAAPFARHGGVLDAARRLHEAGRFATDLDPMEYLHGVRQWSVWTLEERFDLSRFTNAYLAISRRNFEEAEERWTGDAEREARALVPALWNDVRSVLREAGFDPAVTGEPQGERR